MTNEPLWQAILALLTGMALINAFFIRSLIKKIEESSVAVRDLKASLSNMKEKIDTLSDLSHRITVIEKDLAILSYIVKKDHEVMNREEG